MIANQRSPIAADVPDQSFVLIIDNRKSVIGNMMCPFRSLATLASETDSRPNLPGELRET